MTTNYNTKKIHTASANITTERLEMLHQLLPEAFTEGNIDFEKLRATLGDFVDDSPERYTFTWAGKRNAIKLLQIPTSATLVPVRDESINFDDTNHIFIEGENLEVLKLLYKAYFGRVKLIYIDPPYNTGNDFVYPDNYADPLEPYLQLTGQKDIAGNLLTSNTDTSGRFHSTWLSMMYPRLFVARQLLQDDGALFISIGETEVHNLRILLNEIFGEENIVATIVWQKSKRGDSKLIAQIHEYILVAVKNREVAINSGSWRKPKPGADEVLAHYRQLKHSLRGNHKAISKAMREWFKSLPKSDQKRKHKHYQWSDDRGLYFADNFAGPDDGRKSRPRYDIIHPISGKPCKKPRTGWRWEEERTQQALAMDPPLIHFGPDETTVPCRKTYLKDTSLEPFSSVFYRDGRGATLELKNMLGADVMDFPKNTDVLKEIIQIIPDINATVLDFFAGSCPTAQAVLELNQEDEGERRFIMIQLPEPSPRDSKAYQSGFHTVAEIGKERIRQFCSQPQNKLTGQINLSPSRDLGFRVFKLTPSHFKPWSGSPDADPDTYNQQLALFRDPFIEGWQPEPVIWEVAIKEGYPLHSRIAEIDLAGHIVYRVTNPDNDQQFHICLESEITAEIPRQLGLATHDLFICRDLALDDTTAANLALQCHLKTI